MNFYQKKRQRPTVSVISMIDILAILLIFFIVTTTFKQSDSLVKVNLPRSSEMKGVDDAEKRTPLALGEDGQVSLGSLVVPIESLSSALRDFKKTSPEGRLELKADEKAPLGLMVKVWDAATQAGLEIGELPLRILLRE
ncbi:MAG TPA: biopolymer transporter ExbD [Verrucomicrobiales bacterium]|nr:biopolymer transporter ExbD [Verrucomicrobiales bacterium]